MPSKKVNTIPSPSPAYRTPTSKVIARRLYSSSPQTVAILDHLVQQPRGRRIAALLRAAATIVADEAGLAVATVTTATAIDAKQLTRLAAALSKSSGRELRINHVIDPAIVGGVRVQIGDEVTDGTVATKLTELRLQLAS